MADSAEQLSEYKLQLQQVIMWLRNSLIRRLKE